MWHQSEALRHGGPSLFLHDTTAVFAPLYAFYGGTLYVLTGALSIVLGSPAHAYVLTYLLAFAASYGGWWWLARQAGIRGLPAHAPGVVFVTSAYAITLLYLRGDWPEHVAVSMLPLLVASGLSVLWADRLRPWPAAALAISCLLFTGSHNLTLLCGVTVLATLTALVLVCIPEARSRVRLSGLARLGALVVPTLLVNAWFLLPDVAYQSQTIVSAMRPTWVYFLHLFGWYVTAPKLFALDRGTADASVPHLSFALPVLAMAWIVVAAGTARPRLRDPWFRFLLVLAAIAAGLVVVMTHVELLWGPFAMIQFSYRLESYINLMVSGMVLAGLVLLGARRTAARRACTWALAPIAAVSIVLAAGQSIVHVDPSTYAEWHDYPSFYTAKSAPNVGNFSEGHVPAFADAGSGGPRVTFRPQAIRDGRVSATVRAPSGSYVLTNIAGVWPLLRLSGARFVGVNETGRAVVQLDADATAVSTLTVAAATPPAVAIGRLLSFLGIAGLVANFVVMAVRARRRRHRRTDSASRRDEAVAPEPVAV
ncbi:MAG: hypothetical protein JWR63_117 [Conexibacter sp.]|nr:hypothetical protein [Conexibacter sp.]